MPHAHERRFLSVATCPVRVEKRADDKTTIGGYASVFWLPDDPGTQFQLYSDLVERVMPTAFDRALREAQDVRCLRNHNPDMLLGRTLSGTCTLKTDTRGLMYECVPGDTSVARDTLDMITRGDMTGSSFSFSVVKQMFAEEGDTDVREVHDVDLYDVSPVTYPAYEASTCDMRAALLGDDPERIRRDRQAWRDAQAKERAKARIVVPAGLVLARARVVEIEAAAR